MCLKCVNVSAFKVYLKFAKISQVKSLQSKLRTHLKNLMTLCWSLMKYRNHFNTSVHEGAAASVSLIVLDCWLYVSVFDTLHYEEHQRTVPCSLSQWFLLVNVKHLSHICNFTHTRLNDFWVTLDLIFNVEDWIHRKYNKSNVFKSHSDWIKVRQISFNYCSDHNIYFSGETSPLSIYQHAVCCMCWVLLMNTILVS